MALAPRSATRSLRPGYVQPPSGRPRWQLARCLHRDLQEGGARAVDGRERSVPARLLQEKPGCARFQRNMYSYVTVMLGYYCGWHPWWWSPSAYPIVIITCIVTSKHIATTLNYRTPVPVGSYFSVLEKFQEVYHGHGISKARISGGEQAVTGQGRDTIYSVVSSCKNRYISCWLAAARRWGWSISGTYFFRISGGMKKDLCW